MPVPYGHKRSEVAGNVPSSSDFSMPGQVLVNIGDGRAFIDTAGGVKTLVNADDIGTMFEYRNKIINGNFDIWQRGTGPHVGSVFSADRWRITSGTGAVNSVSRGTTTSTIANNYGTSEYTLEWSRTTAGSAESVLSQRIEDVRSVAPGKVTVELAMTASVGTDFQIRVKQVFGVGGSTTVSTASSIRSSSSGVFKTVLNLPSFAGKIIGANSYVELDIVRRHNGVGPTATMRLARVTLTEGDSSLGSGFVSPRHPQQELALCQRYGRLVVLRDLWGGAGAGTYGQMTIDITDMRILPTIIATSKTDELTNAAGFAVEAGTFGGSKFLRAYAGSASSAVAAFIAERFLDAEL